jgi:hypothetical protein
MFTESNLRDAFLCGVVAGRLEKVSASQDESEAERSKVEEEYGPYWPGELLWAGYCELPGGPVNQLEHAGWLAHHTVGAQ